MGSGRVFSDISHLLQCQCQLCSGTLQPLIYKASSAITASAAPSRLLLQMLRRATLGSGFAILRELAVDAAAIDSQQAGGFGDIAIGLLQCPLDQRLLGSFKVERNIR